MLQKKRGLQKFQEMIVILMGLDAHPLHPWELLPKALVEVVDAFDFLVFVLRAHAVIKSLVGVGESKVPQVNLACHQFLKDCFFDLGVLVPEPNDKVFD